MGRENGNRKVARYAGRRRLNPLIYRDKQEIDGQKVHCHQCMLALCQEWKIWCQKAEWTKKKVRTLADSRNDEARSVSWTGDHGDTEAVSTNKGEVWHVHKPIYTEIVLQREQDHLHEGEKVFGMLQKPRSARQNETWVHIEANGAAKWW